MSDSNTHEAARNGDLQAISALISKAIAPRNIIVEAKMQYGLTLLLKIYPLTTMQPQFCSRAVITALNDIQPNKVTAVRISEFAPDKKTQIWNRLLSLKDGKFVDHTTSTNIKVGIAFILFIASVSYYFFPKQSITSSNIGLGNNSIPSQSEITKNPPRKAQKTSIGVSSTTSKSSPTNQKEIAMKSSKPTIKAVSPTPKSEQVSTLEKTGEWNQGGTLHHSGALDWQQASDENKLATCADFISTMWEKKLFNSSIQTQVKSTDDIKVLAQELMTQMDEAMKENPDMDENRKTYANQKVSEMASLLMPVMGWLK